MVARVWAPSHKPKGTMHEIHLPVGPVDTLECTCCLQEAGALAITHAHGVHRCQQGVGVLILHVWAGARRCGEHQIGHALVGCLPAGAGMYQSRCHVLHV